MGIREDAFVGRDKSHPMNTRCCHDDLVCRIAVESAGQMVGLVGNVDPERQ